MTTTFTLKNLKVCEWASEETTCFTATMYVDGKRVGEVSNDGHGGCNSYGFDERKYATIASEWLWNDHINTCNKYDLSAGDRAEFTPDFDSLVCELVEQAELAKQVRSYKNKMVKKYPQHADKLRFYITGDSIQMVLADSKQEQDLLSESPDAVIAQTEASLTI